MDKSKIKSEDWILLALKNTSERYGLDLTKWYLSERPDEFDIDQAHFFELIDKMETTGIIKNASSNAVNYCLTNMGKKEAMRFKKRFKFDDYYLIISKFPDIELKERIEIIESFLISSIGLFLIILWGEIPSSYYGSDFNVLIVVFFYMIISILIVYYFSFNFAKIIIFWIIGLQRDTLWIYKEWLWDNQNKIIYPLPALVIFIILFGMYYWNIVPLKSIIWGLVLLFISYIGANYKKVNEIIKSKFEKHLKPL